MEISNYYVKGKGQAGNEVIVSIEDDGAFTICPICGKEHRVDLVELAARKGFDLYGTTVYCESCVKRRKAYKE